MKNLMIVLMLVAVVAVSGCVNLPSFSRDEKATAFAGGTDGLTMEFQDLPDTIFTGVPFQLVVLVQNAGETPLKAGTASFTLNNAALFGVTPSAVNNQNLIATKLVQGTITPGGQEFVSWKSSTGKPPKFTGTVLTEQQTIPLTVDACYSYSTTMLATACVARTKKICEPVGIKPVENSGAPIQVTEFKQVAQPDGDNINFNFILSVENQGDGSVFSSAANCPGPSIDLQNYVYLSAIKLGSAKNLQVVSTCGNAKTDCCDEVSIALDDRGRGSTSCSLTIPSTTDYQDQLSIVLAYRYKDRITRSIAVVPP